MKPSSRSPLLLLVLICGLPPAAMASGDWEGPYLGANAGIVFGSNRENSTLVEGGSFYEATPFSPSALDLSGAGGTFGPEAGYRWQFGKFVIGGAVDVSHAWFDSNSAASGTDARDRPFNIGQKSSLDWLGTLRGSVGYAPNSSWLLYASGGLAAGEVASTSNLSFPLGGTIYQGSRSSWQAGWTVGAGVDHRLARNWAVRLEYLHYNLGDETVIGYPQRLSNFHTQADNPFDGNVLRLGLEYDLGTGGGGAADRGPDNRVLIFLNKLGYEFGIRYWYGFGSFRYKLDNGNGTVPLSKLTYSGLGSNASEVFLQIDHPMGFFVDGFAGIGNNSVGTLKDEDYAGSLGPYSATVSQLDNGGLQYAKIDFGYNLLNRDIIKLGPFIGYGYLGEQMNAYGCSQIATNQNVCAAGISPGALTLSENSSWNFARIGLAERVRLASGLHLRAEAAWVPGGSFGGQDHHWLRIDTPSAFGLTGPLIQSGPVQGAQIEAALELDVTPSFHIGAGARYWYLTSSGTMVFPLLGGSTSTQVAHFTTQHFGPFVQASFRF